MAEAPSDPLPAAADRPAPAGQAPQVATDAPTRVASETGFVLAWEDGSPAQTTAGSARYELRGELARGGLGQIHFAWDRRLARAVAIKVPLTESAQARFYREALLTARLQHPGIVPVYDAGNGDDGAPFYAMRLLGEGRSFSDAIAATTSLDERLTLLPHVIAAADAVAYAHSQRIIHRDLKPDNILLGPFGETVVIDWGLAKDLTIFEPLDQETTAPRPPAAAALPPAAGTPTPSPSLLTPLTLAGTTVGTPAYMSPEQVFQGQVDERTDVYSLGTVLLELLLGKKAAIAGRQAIAAGSELRRLLPPGVPADLLAILRKAVADDQDQRYPSARELAADLRRFAAGQLVKAHVYSPLTLLGRFLSRHRLPVGIAAAALLLLALFATASVRRILSERNIAEAARERAEERGDAVTLVQARTSLDRDPTATLAWLATYREEAANQDQLRSLLADAAARGVARHVLPFKDRVQAVGFARGGRQLVAADYVGLLRLFDRDSGALLREWQRPGGTSRLLVLENGDGLRILTGGVDGRLLLFDLAAPAGAEPVVFKGHSAVVTAMVLLGDGKKVLSSSRDGSVWRFDLSTGSGRELARHRGSVNGLVLTADEKLAISGGIDGQLQLIDLEGERPPRSLELGGAVAKLAILPGSTANAPRLAVAGEDHKVRLFDLAGGQNRVLIEHQGIIGAIAASPNGRYLASCSRDRSIRLADLEAPVAAGKAPPLRIFGGPTDDPETLRFSPAGDLLAVAGLDGTIQLIEIASGRQRALYGTKLMIEALAFSPDGHWLAAGTQDSDVRVWPTRQERVQVLAGHDNDVDTLLFLPGAPGEGPAALASAGHDKTIRLWPRQGDSFAATPRVLTGHQQSVDHLALLPGGHFLASGSADFSVRIWDLEKGESQALLGHTHAITGLAVAAGGQTLLSASQDGSVRVWDLDKGGGGRLRHVLAGHQGAVLQLALSADEKLLATGGADRSVRLWDWQKGSQLATLEGHSDQVGVLAFAPDGKILASGSWDGMVRLWQGDNFRDSRPLPGHNERVRALLFSPDGQILATSSLDHSIRLWSLPSGEAKVLRGHQASVRHLAFAPDGQLLASSSTDRTARLWHVASGELRALRRFEGIVTTSVFSPDGRFLAIGGWDKLVHVYPTYRDHLMPIGPGSSRRRIAELTSASTDPYGKIATRPPAP